MSPPAAHPLKAKEAWRHEVRAGMFVEAGGKLQDAGGVRIVALDGHPVRRF